MRLYPSLPSAWYGAGSLGRGLRDAGNTESNNGINHKPWHGAGSLVASLAFFLPPSLQSMAVGGSECGLCVCVCVCVCACVCVCRTGIAPRRLARSTAQRRGTRTYPPLHAVAIDNGTLQSITSDFTVDYFCRLQSSKIDYSRLKSITVV